MPSQLWLGLCAAAALLLLLALVIRWRVHAFLALLLVSLGLGLAAGLPPAATVDAIKTGIGDLLRDVAVLLALGALLGRLLEASGAAELIASRLLRLFGSAHASTALLLAALLIGIPILFNVGFLLLVPIVWRLQRQTGRSLLHFLLPLCFGLGMTHSLVPPHPGVVGAVKTLAGPQSDRVMVEMILFGSLLSGAVALVGWFGPGRWWAARQFVTAPEALIAPEPTDDAPPPARSLTMALAIVLSPLMLSVVGFGAQMLHDLRQLPEWLTRPLGEELALALAPPVAALLGQDATALPERLDLLAHSPLDWLRFLGKPEVALAVPTALAIVCYGTRGALRVPLAKLTTTALQDVGGMVFLFGAAGGFKQVIAQTGVGRVLADALLGLPLSPVALAFLVTALVRIALGSATAAILTASALLTGLARDLPGRETVLALAVACGATFMTQPADSGFWMVKEFGNLSVRDVMLRFNACRILMALTGLAILLAYEWLF